MIKFKWYRYIRVKLGARSFVMNNVKGPTYLVVSGGYNQRFIDEMINMGFVQEWSE